MALLAAAVAGELSPLLEYSRTLHGSIVSVFASEPGVRGGCGFRVCWRCRFGPELLPRMGRAAVFAACSGWASTVSTVYLKGGDTAVVFACVEYRLGREALLTANPPQPSRPIPEGVLHGYVARLIADGVSASRLAAKLASTAGGGAALVAVYTLGRRGCNAAAYLAVHGSRKLCMLHTGRAAAATAPASGAGDCYQNIVVRLQPLAGAVRVEAKPIERVLYS